MSHIARLFIEEPIAEGQSVPLPDSQSKYLTRVMRLQAGAIVRAFNGDDGEWRCELRVAGKKVDLVPLRLTRAPSKGPDLTLLFAPVKKNRTDFIVEKATELGVSAIQPVITEYTQTQRVRTDRMRLLAIEAAEQTERLDLPEIRDSVSLPVALAGWVPGKPLLYCDEAGEAATIDQFRTRLSGTGGGVLVGPEGGFSPRERKMLHALDFVTPITLGPRILRAETAVVSALTLWQSSVGDWQNAPYLPETK